MSEPPSDTTTPPHQHNMNATNFYNLYRETIIGTTLADSIDKLINAGKLTPQLANSLMCHFDKAIATHLADKVKTSLIIKGKIGTYRYCDEIWTFVLEEIYMKLSSGRNTLEEMNVKGKVRVVACNSQKPSGDP